MCAKLLSNEAKLQNPSEFSSISVHKWGLMGLESHNIEVIHILPQNLKSQTVHYTKDINTESVRRIGSVEREMCIKSTVFKV